MAKVEVACRDIYGELKEYVDENLGVVKKRLRKMEWKKRGKYVDKRHESIRREKRWK